MSPSALTRFVVASFACVLILVLSLVGVTAYMESQVASTNAKQTAQEQVLSAYEKQVETIVSDVQTLLTNGKTTAAKNAKQTLMLVQLQVDLFKALFAETGDVLLQNVANHNAVCELFRGIGGTKPFEALAKKAQKVCLNFKAPSITIGNNGVVHNTTGVPGYKPPTVNASAS